ncbi:complex I subunit 5 family protein [Roseburia sp. 1XD42-69]|uniref:complex I subunit 5 family protein n=1 Tax=Roseburia sp. 1XD42-69 TaxID=2320088 RepID=UPI000EA3B8DA|nr:proton-conducting transporter membrane subunit [Roseburia sp. 1XD42-69]RKJ62019.1 proton-conducting membrane transporter [Roseburia sp. 1XD42-69]
MNHILLFPIVFPILAGIMLLTVMKYQNRKPLLAYVGTVLGVNALWGLFAMFRVSEGVTVFYLTKSLPIYLKVDTVGRLFASLMVLVWLLGGLFSFEYMKHEKNEQRFYGFYLILCGVLFGLDFSGNLITLYLFYEFMTLTALPLVLHTQTKEAVMAGLKYLFYSFAGAYMALFGVFFIGRYAKTLEFTPGGVIDPSVFRENETLFFVVAMLMILGFSVKAGMFPMHAWLTAAHPAAPGPASAVLSGIIVKGGILALIRVVYEIIGVDFLRGSWVQQWWMILSLLTVFLGSLLAFREPVLKKRLAYSTVSQLSYILFGLSLFEVQAMTGSLLHIIAHVFIKVALFFTAAAIIYMTGCKRVEELRGVAKGMPVTMWCYTIVSLGLIGIPPTSGFISKWYLAEGALHTGIPVFSWLGPVILLLSALLTAGYLLPLSMRGFFPGEGYDAGRFAGKEPPLSMRVPLLIFAGLTLGIGLFPNVFTNILSAAADFLM